MPHVGQTLPQDGAELAGRSGGPERGGWLLQGSPKVLSSGLQALT